MSFTTMYDAQVNSITTSVNEALSDSDTTITVADGSLLPAGPNIAVIGTGEDAETILYTAISTNDLTGCTRGFQGTAAAWDSGTQIARLFTEYDLEAIQDNIDKLIENNKENLIIDGNFDYWLETIEEEDPDTLDYIHTLTAVKHAKTSGTRPTITLSRETLTKGELAGSFYANRCNADGADSSMDNGSYYVAWRHYIHRGVIKHANGDPITVRLSMKSSVAGQKVGVCIRQNYGSGGSPDSEEDLTGEIHTLTTSRANYDTTITTNTNTGKTFGTDLNDCLIVDVFVQAGSTVASSLFSGSSFGFTAAVNIDLCQFAAYRGSEAYDFVARDDFKKILPFYWKTYNPDVIPGTVTNIGMYYPLTVKTGTYPITPLLFYPGGVMISTPDITPYSPTTGAADKLRMYSGVDSDYTCTIRSGFAGESFWTGRLQSGTSIPAQSDISIHLTADARY